MSAIPFYEVWKNVKSQFIAKPGELSLISISMLTNIMIRDIY